MGRVWGGGGARGKDSEQDSLEEDEEEDGEEENEGGPSRPIGWVEKVRNPRP